MSVQEDKAETAEDKAGHKATAEADALATKQSLSTTQLWQEVGLRSKGPPGLWTEMGDLGSQLRLVTTIKVFWFPSAGPDSNILCFLEFQWNRSLQK